MTIINTSPDRIIQLGYEGEDRVTVLRFRYGADWLENGEGIFRIRVRRHGEKQAYNAQLVADDAENNCLLMTVTDVELSVKGSGEMQVVYSGADFVKKSPIYSYNVSRAVDEAVDPPAQDVYTQIIESLSDLQTDVSGITEDIGQIENSIGALSALTTAKIGDLTELTTEAKNDLVSAINEVNSKSVDDVLSATSTNPVQNKVITEHIDSLNSTIDDLGESIEDVQTAVQDKADIQTVSALADAVQGLDSDVQGLQTTMQNKADTSTVTALSGTVSGLQTTVQSKADAQTVTALSGTVTDLQTSKADKTYVDVQLDGKASTQTVSDLVDDVYDIYPTDTASGVIANFPDGANSVPVKSLTVAIEPVQDLHGYSNPWPGGATKNKMPNAIPKTETINGVTFTLDQFGVFTVNGTATSEAMCRFPIGYSFTILDGDPRPKLALNNTQATSALFQFFNGNVQVDSWSINPVNRAQEYSSMRRKTCNEYIIRVPKDATVNFTMSPMIVENSESDYSYIPYSNICPITGWTGAKVTVSPTTDEEDGTTYDITFPSEAGTVYGGSLTIAEDGSGVLTVDRAIRTNAQLINDTFTIAGRGGFVNQAVTLPRVRNQDFISPKLLSTTAVTSSQNNLYQNAKYGIAYWWSEEVGISTGDESISTVAQFKEWLAENGMDIVYPLATSITYTLTASQIRTLLGQNNIWADTGDVAVKYNADTKLYIDNKITQAIAAALNS